MYNRFIKQEYKKLDDINANVRFNANPQLKRDATNAVAINIRDYQQQAVEYISSFEDDINNLLRNKYGVEEPDFRYEDFNAEELVEMFPIQADQPGQSALP